MSQLKKYAGFIVVGTVSASLALGVNHILTTKSEENTSLNVHSVNTEIPDHQEVVEGELGKFVSFDPEHLGNDFSMASAKSLPAVVSVKNYGKQHQNRGGSMEEDLFRYFFEDPRGQGRGRAEEQNQDMPSSLGSGVIIDPNGYIVTNNHVVENAEKLEIVLNNQKTYTAELIGTDPSTDIALLKISENKLPFLSFTDSNKTKIGQWVLAVGNPMGLNSTVTAGIISAKGRSIDALSRNASGQPGIESFIQTDAAINKGNSGGALVDAQGNLVGINSAIYSSSGYYQGYGFAIPSNLAYKVIEDLKKYGMVQRGFLGIQAVDLSNDMALKRYNKEQKTDYTSGQGLLISEIVADSAAEHSGLKKGDIITQVDNVTIGKFADLTLIIGSKRPGDAVMVAYLRGGKPQSAKVILRDSKGNTKIRKKDELTVSERIGANFKELDKKTKNYFGIDHGVVVEKVRNGGLLSSIGLQDNYIILEVNGKQVRNENDIEKALKNHKDTVSIKYLDDYGRVIQRGFSWD